MIQTIFFIGFALIGGTLSGMGGSAIGKKMDMTGKDTRKVFTNEAVILCIIGALAGLIFAVIIMTIVHFIPINNDSLSFFLQKGHFTFKVSFVSVVLQYLILIVLTTLAVRGSAKQAASMNPAEALRTVK